MSSRNVTGELRLLIDGRLIGARSGETYDNIDPATEQSLGTTADASLADLDLAITAARRAFDETDWSTDHKFRRRCLEQLLTATEEAADGFRMIDTAEAGRPYVRTLGSVNRNIPALGIWAELAGGYDYEQSLSTFRTPGQGLLQREGYGVIGAIFTWNCGFYLNVMKIGPALAAGNTIVVRPAPETPWQTTMFGRLIAERTDIPPGVVNIVTSQRPDIAEALTLDPRVDLVTFTGSTTVGKQIMAQAAATMKKVHLELGGKSAAIMLDDVDLEISVPLVTEPLCYNAGQTCSALTRLLLPRSRYAEGVEIARASLSGVHVGDPWDPQCRQGPQISARHRDRVLNYIEMAKSDCRLVLGGGVPKNLTRGYFIEPTVFADVSPNHAIAQEEIFGPVLAVIPYEDDEDAVHIANDSIYGLAGAVHSKSTERAVAVARRIRTGQVAVNGALSNGPFGGYKQSGIGREVGVWGFEEFLETKSIGLPASGN